MLGEGWCGGGVAGGGGRVRSERSRRGGGDVVMGDGVLRESGCDAMGNGGGRGRQGVKGEIGRAHV